MAYYAPTASRTRPGFSLLFVGFPRPAGDLVVVSETQGKRPFLRLFPVGGGWVTKGFKRKEVSDPHGLLRTHGLENSPRLQPAVRRLSRRRRDRRGHAPLLVERPLPQGDHLRDPGDDPVAADPHRDQPPHPLAAEH